MAMKRGERHAMAMAWLMSIVNMTDGFTERSEPEVAI
jgi:hypothetical protein